MDIRLKTVMIIRKDGKYLQGRIIYSKQLKWTGSPWEAWRTRIRAEARSVRDKVGGDILLWNPIVGQLKEMTL